ncbi:fibronectin type III domain-containing protein [Paenibacillus sp. MMS20-IR301]|uniref:fibronectin type III domain-containing protein n=1 Tax=Paenibacillus sp. MMS20-IR301 TaxID=2895946 RepID=UPI0028EC2B01|nr:PA14 domain-containing protein [Paenibacillus sp. MMS20-IR301]WNS43263.1 PA14 domain-containing protein [Paenibacillus sp. MMS20-IR301]
MGRNKKFLVKLLCLLLVSQLGTSFIGGTAMKVLAQGDTLKIHFQPLHGSVPAGYIADYGDIYAARNGHEYGWNKDHTTATVTRSTYRDSYNNVSATESTYSDNIHDTLTRISPGGEWEIQVDNGNYEVAVTVGDAVYDSKNALAVEGTEFWSDMNLKAGEHATRSKIVTVTDGKLTVSQIDGPDVETALNTVEITLVNMFTPVISPPRIGLPAEQNKIAGNKVLMSGTMINVHSAPPYTYVNGLREEISRHMSEQVAGISEQVQQYEHAATVVNGSDAAAIQQKILSETQSPAVIRSGHLNLEASVTFGSPDKPVILIVDGINSNQNLTITVYGSLILRGGLNANAPLTVQIMNSSNTVPDGNLWVQGAFQLNNNLKFHVDNELYAGSLTYNGGTLQIEAKRVLVQGNMNINTNVTMNIEEEMSAGEIVSNNLLANLNVKKGDLFVRDNVSVNNNLNITTGGLFAVGGNLITNQRPQIHTGNGTEGQTLLKYVLSGLKAEYFSGNNFTGQKAVKLDESVFLSGQPVLPVSGIANQHFSVRWTGQVQPKYSGLYTFSVNTGGGVRLWVDNQLLVDKWNAQNNTGQGLVQLQAGVKYDLRMEYANDQGNPQANLFWESDKQSREAVPSVYLRPFGIPEPIPIPAATAITLQWPAQFNADGYEVEIDGEISPLGPETGYVADHLSPGTEHTYRVRANSEDIKGEWSLLTPYWTLPAVPQNISMASTSNSITLNWEPVIGATSYEVEVNNSIQNIGNVTSYLEDQLIPNMQKIFRIRAVNSSGPGAWSGIIAKSTIVAAPGNLSGTAADQSIALQWDAVSGAIAYDVEADGTQIENITETSYSHNGLEPNSIHEYRVRAHNENGISDWSSKITVYTTPGIPRNLSATVEGSAIRVTWDTVKGASGYDIEVDGSIIDNGTDTEYNHTELSLNSEHTYRVRAKNQQAAGEWTSLIVYTTHAGVPNNVRSTATSSEITLTWDPVPGATGYDIEVDGTVVHGGLDNSYIHSGLKPFSTHSYRIRARNAGGTGEWSREVSAKTVFGKPENLTAVAYNSSIKLSWDKVEGATGYDLLVDGEIIDNGQMTSYEHTGLEPYSWHVYRVRGKYGESLGEWSSALTKSTILGIPGNIKVKALSDQITLSWDAVIGATGYEIEADGKTIDNGAKLSFTDSKLSSNTKHTYRIRAKNSQVMGEWSDWTTTITSVTAPGVPQNFTGVATINSIELSWDSVEGAALYDLEVDGKIITDITVTEYKHLGLEPNTMHNYRVRARNSGASSDWTDKLKKVTTPALTIQPEKDSQFNFVIIVPQKSGLTERKVTVTYSAEDLEVIDLRAETPELETAAGAISGTPIVITSYEPGRIVYTIQSTGKTVMNTIKLSARTNELTKVTYKIE